MASCPVSLLQIATIQQEYSSDLPQKGAAHPQSSCGQSHPAISLQDIQFRFQLKKHHRFL
jgi:hypothetical protein